MKSADASADCRKRARALIVRSPIEPNHRSEAFIHPVSPIVNEFMAEVFTHIWLESFDFSHLKSRSSCRDTATEATTPRVKLWRESGGAQGPVRL